MDIHIPPPEAPIQASPWPPSPNDTEAYTVINGVPMNLTALLHWNYTWYEGNYTISNMSKCFISQNTTWKDYQPFMFPNGTWINGTSCYGPWPGNHIGARGTYGAVMASVFGLSIVFSLLNLVRLGKLHLHEDKRFRAVGRRWQWYWAMFIAGSAMISGITSIDVERNYILELPIILQSFFYTLMLPGALAMAWEASRHWGSWQERQICDRDPYALRQDDKRATSEFYQPLVFYLFAWLCFFCTVPRSWTNVRMQRTPEQTAALAVPTATDARFKVGAIFALLAFCVICYNLRHNIHYYKPRSKGFLASINGFCLHCPTKIFLLIVILAVRLAYQVAGSWRWDLSPLNRHVDNGWLYGLGYGSILVMVVLLQIWGLFFEENEDVVLIRQRRERGRAMDFELGITKRPTWWSKMHGDQHLTSEARLRALTTLPGAGGETNYTDQRPTQNVELTGMGGIRNRSRQRDIDDLGGISAAAAATNRVTHNINNNNNPFRDASPSRRGPTNASQFGLSVERNDRALSQWTGDDASRRSSALTGTTAGGSEPPVKIRSMLNV